MAKEVMKQEELPLELFEGMDSGFEGTDAQTFKTPFLKILQTLSPELKKSDPKYLPEAEEGMFCNSATQQLYSSINIIILKVEHSLLVWKPDRGGFVGRYSKQEENNIVSTREGIQKWDQDGNEVVDTIEFFCMNAEDQSDIFILPLSTASLKHAKSFATRLRLLKCNGKAVNVSWAGVWNISTVEESNDKGSWFTIGSTPKFIEFITKEIKDNYISPAKELLTTADTDYSTIESTSNIEENNEDVDF